MRHPIAWMALVAICAGGGAAADTPKRKKLTKPESLRRTPMRTDNHTLDAHLKDLCAKARGGGGQWTVTCSGVNMTVITDEGADRMRIIAPITDATKLSKAQLLSMMEANFDRALDAKYAIWRDVVWSTFVHPLSPLTREELASALKQVAALRQNYGTSYSSSDIVFGP